MRLPSVAFSIPAGIVLGMALSALFRFERRQRRSNVLLEIENKIDRLLKEAGIPYDPYASAPEMVGQAIRAGKVMDAIRLYRESCGVTLKDAKEFVDHLTSPENQISIKLDLLLKKAAVH